MQSYPPNSALIVAKKDDVSAANPFCSIVGTVYIPNGINRSNILECNNINKKWNLEKDSYILFLGRIVPEKGVKYLIEAFKQINTDKQLVIAGGSSDTDEFMKEICNLAKDDNRILFTGFVEGISYYRQNICKNKAENVK